LRFSRAPRFASPDLRHDLRPEPGGGVALFDPSERGRAVAGAGGPDAIERRQHRAADIVVGVLQVERKRRLDARQRVLGYEVGEVMGDEEVRAAGPGRLQDMAILHVVERQHAGASELQ